MTTLDLTFSLRSIPARSCPRVLMETLTRDHLVAAIGKVVFSRGVVCPWRRIRGSLSGRSRPVKTPKTRRKEALRKELNRPNHSQYHLHNSNVSEAYPGVQLRPPCRTLCTVTQALGIGEWEGSRITQVRRQSRQSH